MADKLTVGMQLCARFTDGVFYSAKVLATSKSKRRAKAPVKVHYDGYGRQSDAWVSLAQLRSKVLKTDPNLKACALTSKRLRWMPVLKEDTTEGADIMTETYEVTVSLMSGEVVAISGFPFQFTGSDLRKKLQAARPLKEDAMYDLFTGDTIIWMHTPLSSQMQFSAVVQLRPTIIKVQFSAVFPSNSTDPQYKADVRLGPDDGTELPDLVGEGFEFDPDDVVEIPGPLLSMKLVQMLDFTRELQQAYPPFKGQIKGSKEELNAALELMNNARSTECFIDDQIGGTRACLVAKVAGHIVKANFNMKFHSGCSWQLGGPRIGFKRDSAGYILPDQGHGIKCIGYR